MRFVLTEDQRDFGASLDALLAAGDPVGAARAWAAGDTGPGLGLWKRLADQGVTALLVPEEHGGVGAGPVEMVVALEAIGRHGLPGPWVESVAHLPLALADGDHLAALAGGAVGTVAAPPEAPYALDADTADLVLVADGSAISTATVGEVRQSVDRTRRLATVRADAPAAAADLVTARESAVLATSAQLLGCGERILADAVTYVKQRRQFGREIGSYQAVKHALADVRIALDFARPLVHGAALGEVPAAAAKVACADAAYLASRTGLQVHGAIGYTEEFDLSIWLTKVRALVTAWGTPTQHRAALLGTLLEGRAG
ncbi:acyl-CoA dehydrogenase family protein [Nocardioides sp. SYSU DS0663]|uniref:acyl-CoA dehydrogenase family protein n=1 Tax=Nocardioides sp. SYSU DS0663 TaxID=3416445 RepID=UPI003F4B2427